MEENKSHELNDVLASVEFKDWCKKSTQAVFENLFNENLAPNDPAVKLDSRSNEISAVIAFMGTKIEATLQLSCSRQTIIKLVEKNYGTDFTETQSFFFLGEAVNVVFGMLKEKLNLFGLYYEKCLPVVVAGQDHLILNLSSGEILSQNYMTPFGVICLRVGLNSRAVFSKNAA